MKKLTLHEQIDGTWKQIMVNPVRRDGTMSIKNPKWHGTLQQIIARQCAMIATTEGVGRIETACYGHKFIAVIT